jgi:hypothetical protein
MGIISRSRPAPTDLAQEPSDRAELARARRRVTKMSSHELLNWADAAGTGMARAFGDFRRAGEVTSLDEVHGALLALAAVTDELKLRAEMEV